MVRRERSTGKKKPAELRPATGKSARLHIVRYSIIFKLFGANYD